MEEKNETGPAVEPRPEQQCKQARPHDELIAELLDSRRLKTEREHAAAREIERLRELCDDLYSDLLAAGSLAPHDCGAYALIQETIKLRRDRWARKQAPNAELWGRRSAASSGPTRTPGSTPGTTTPEGAN